MRLRGIGQGPQRSGELAYLQGRPDTNEVLTNVSAQRFAPSSTTSP
jgi:hypothetical protein